MRGESVLLKARGCHNTAHVLSRLLFQFLCGFAKKFQVKIARQSLQTQKTNIIADGRVVRYLENCRPLINLVKHRLINHRHIISHVPFDLRGQELPFEPGNLIKDRSRLLIPALHQVVPTKSRKYDGHKLDVVLLAPRNIGGGNTSRVVFRLSW